MRRTVSTLFSIGRVQKRSIQPHLHIVDSKWLDRAEKLVN